MPEIIYNPLSFQEQFHNSRNAKVFLSGGYGCGKTYSLSMKMFQLCDANPGIPGGILVPNLKMFKRDVLPTIREICAENAIDYHFNKNDSMFEFYDTGSTIYVFHAEDDGASIRGPNLGFFLMNEVTLISKPAFDAAIARVRVKDAPFRQIAMSGTHEGFGWAYQYFFEEPRADTDIIYGDTRLNHHLAEDYVQMLLNSYDDKMVEQYVYGKPVNLRANPAAWAFDRRKHVGPVEYDPHLPIWVSLDFNVNPMAATLWNRYPAGIGVPLRAFDEITLNSSNTEELCRVLKHKLDELPCPVDRDNKPLPKLKPLIYPDPAGRAGSTKSHFSDLDILRNNGFAEQKFKKQLSIKDCLNALNAMLAKNEIVISPKCKNLIADFEQCSLKSDIFEIDKTDPRRTHWLDGAKNMIDYEFPVFKPNSIKVSRYA